MLLPEEDHPQVETFERSPPLSVHSCQDFFPNEQLIMIHAAEAVHISQVF
ncbi:hypothetical protein Poly21_02440 [Allorhodopirellula heiligendammensis]|uniref:Uncharacterized protein n=1 Tax=Allorhodopirellula heiligendammensis TaxID=2714739 RepID=A0A5C6C5N7_9BACT|nr:hypothetical protein Poly21_02440 [Allorhodopirellula heiligendammensis]